MNPYQDIIHLEHPISRKRPQMSLDARAAQFAPYAAQVGHQELIHSQEYASDHDPDPDREIIPEINPDDFYD